MESESDIERSMDDRRTQEQATVGNVSAAMLRLSTLSESQIQELASSGKLTELSPYQLAGELSEDELSDAQLARLAAPSRTLTKQERVRVDNGCPALARPRSIVAFLVCQVKARLGLIRHRRSRAGLIESLKKRPR